MKTIISRTTGAISLIMLLFFSSCQPDRQTVLPEPVGNKPPDKDTVSTNPHQPDSVSVFKRIVINWAPTDYVELIMDAANKPLRYTTQFLYIQGTDKVRTVKYDFIYDANQQLTQLKLDNGFYVNYTYESGRISKTEEYNKAGMLLSTREYEYSADGKQLTGIQKYELAGKSKTGMRYQFLYSNGNLSEIRQSVEDSQTGSYVHGLTTRFSNYDQQKNVENLTTVYPYLPDVMFSTNNPGVVTTYDAKGNEITTARKRFTYTYNAQGYVRTRTESGAGGELNSGYSYSGF